MTEIILFCVLRVTCVYIACVLRREMRRNSHNKSRLKVADIP